MNPPSYNTHPPTRVGERGADGQLLAGVRLRVQAQELGEPAAVEGADEDLEDGEGCVWFYVGFIYVG